MRSEPAAAGSTSDGALSPYFFPAFNLFYLLDNAKLSLEDFRRKVADNGLPQALQLEVELPLAGSAAELNVTVSSHDFLLRGTSTAASPKPPPYHMHLHFPFLVDDSAAVPRFSATKKNLSVLLPVTGRAKKGTPMPPSRCEERQLRWREVANLQNKLVFELCEPISDNLSL